MAYWLDEGWHNWPEILRAGTAAAGLYARCGSYIAEKLTDGFVPAELARQYGTPEWIGRLVDVGLWRIDELGFWDTRYFPLNPTKEKIDERKRQAADRQQRYRDAHGSTHKSRDSNASRSAQLTRTPTSPKGEGDVGARHAPDVDPISQHCRICDFPAANGRHLRAV